MSGKESEQNNNNSNNNNLEQCTKSNSADSFTEKKRVPEAKIHEPFENFVKKTNNEPSDEESQDDHKLNKKNSSDSYGKSNESRGIFTKTMSELFQKEFQKNKDNIELNIIKTIKNDMQDDDDKIEFKEEIKDSHDSDLSTESQSKLREKIRRQILFEYIYPDSIETVKTFLNDRKCCSFLLQAMRGIKLLIAHIFVPILLLSHTKWGNYNLDFAATVLSIVAAGFEIADRVIVFHNKKRREKINILLKSLGIDFQLPETLLDEPNGEEKKKVHLHPF